MTVTTEQWSHNDTEVQVTLSVSESTVPKDVKCIVQRTHLKLVIAGHEFAFANASQFPIYQLPTYQRKETSLMKSNNLKHHLLSAMALAVLLVPAKINAAEPLKVFILAGQSNTVGHARAHTIATLYASDAARDKELIELVIGANSGISNATLEEQLVRGRKLDELTGGISNDKVKALSDGTLECSA